MGVPDKQRIERMAQGVADGLCYLHAGVAAGYGRNSTSCIYKAARDPAFLARVETLVRQRQLGGSSDVAPVIVLMFDCAEDSRRLRTGVGMTAAHRFLADAARLKQGLPPRLAPGELTEAEWRRTHGPKS
ncbi:MAG TPA: hypothetical protein VGI30_01240 [Caulobacteraceae bacterium]|jgi:hypothetical protein